MFSGINKAAAGTESNNHRTHVNPKRWAVAGASVLGVALAIGAVLHSGVEARAKAVKAAAAPALSSVGVSVPVQRELDTQAAFLGQYSAVDKVELRAQVGGTLTEIHFKDGDIVHKGDLLFVIDPEPYQIHMSQAQASLEAAKARLDLASRELVRAQTLKATDASYRVFYDVPAAERALSGYGAYTRLP